MPSRDPIATRVPFALALLVSLVLSEAAAAQDDVPLEVQAVLIKKILSFDQTLTERGAPLTVLVVADEGDLAGAKILVDAFAKVGVAARIASSASAPGLVAGTSAVYVLGTRPGPELRRALVESGVLSFASDARRAERGEVSVALGLEAGRPKIIVHLGRLTEERHQLSAQLLALAKVIR